jgi:hypothetical protein
MTRSPEPRLIQLWKVGRWTGVAIIQLIIATGTAAPTHPSRALLSLSRSAVAYGLKVIHLGMKVLYYLANRGIQMLSCERLEYRDVCGK